MEFVGYEVEVIVIRRYRQVKNVTISWNGKTKKLNYNSTLSFKNSCE